MSPSFLEQTCTLISAHDENSRTQFLLGFENLVVDFVIKNLATREKLSISGVSRSQMQPAPLPSYAYDVLIANCRSPRQKIVYIYYILERL